MAQRVRVVSRGSMWGSGGRVLGMRVASMVLPVPVDADHRSFRRGFRKRRRRSLGRMAECAHCRCWRSTCFPFRAGAESSWFRECPRNPH